MKKREKNSAKNKYSNGDYFFPEQAEQQKVQQHYFSELEKYQEQISRCEKSVGDGEQAA